MFKDIILKPLYNERENLKRKKLLNYLKLFFCISMKIKEYKNICKYFKFKPKNYNFSEIPYLTSTVFKENLILYSKI